MKVALVHDWLTGMRGGEKCLEVFCEMFPNADLYTLLYIPGTVSKTIERMNIKTSSLQKFPWSAKKYRYYLPFFPSIVESWKVSDESYDLVLSSCHCVAKGLKFPKAKRHVCYCFTPMRYLWCQAEQYATSVLRKLALNVVKDRLKQWDVKSNEGVDEFIGISNHVSNRIQRFYGRRAVTIYPPVDTQFYHPNQTPREDFYLVAGALEPYKRVDLVLDAFRQWNRPLKVVGKGTQLESLRRIAPPHVEFLGWRSDEEIRELYRKAKGLIFPGEEDFGIVPLEAQACGCPVIAYKAGGLLETVVENKTGVFFSDPNPESLLKTLKDFETLKWNSDALRSQAERFSCEKFRQEMEKYLSLK